VALKALALARAAGFEASTIVRHPG
jgi:hypothetical protein